LTDIVLRRNAIKNLKIIKKLKNVVYDLRFFGSAVFSQAYLAKGSADIYFTAETNSWDVAAGLLIAEEAGAIATDFNGNKWKPKKGAFIVANKNLHSKILKILKEFA
jgi:myo-inositol-1(or 4)-monophosphatase